MTEAMVGDAKAVAIEFFHAMHEWEKWSAGIDMNRPSEETYDDRLARLVAIFNKYLSAKALKRKQSRYEFLDFKIPPEFSRGISDVEPADGGKVRIYTPIGAMNGRARFLMESEGGTWKVAFREDDAANTGKWRKALDL